MSILSENLRRLRIEKNYTQENAAELLGVSAKAVSRWECGNSLPDVLLLPEIAKLYCITVDDLYKEKTVAYANNAERLAAVYESTKQPKDFLQADLEYKKLIESREYTANDLRMYGIIHQYMMNYCSKKAAELYEEAIKTSLGKNEEVYWKTRRQKIVLLSQLGRDEENIESQLSMVEEQPQNVRELELLITSYYCAKQYNQAYECFKSAVEKFPCDKLIWLCGGDTCRKLKMYDEAFLCWDKALSLDSYFFDAKYSKGFCYEEIGEYEKAYNIWNEIAEELDSKGYESEKTFPQQLAKSALIFLKLLT